MAKKSFGILILFFIVALGVYAGGDKEIHDFSIEYNDGSYGIKCINPYYLTPSQIKSELTVVAYTQDREEQFNLTDDISIEKKGNGWVATYEYKTGVWVFGSRKTITEPVLINPLKSLSVVYPDSNGTCLRINQSKLADSDVKRLKIQASFSSGEREDVTDYCTTSSIDNESINVIYKLKGQDYKKSFELNLDKLVNLEVTRSDSTGSILPNYPLPTEDEIKSNVVVQALYSSSEKINVTDNSTYKIQGNKILFYYGDKNAEIPLDILTEISASTLTGEKIKVLNFSMPNEVAIRNNLLVTVHYSNGFQKDVTKEVDISVSGSKVTIKYGDYSLVGDFLIDVSVQSWMILLSLIAVTVVLVVFTTMYFKKTKLRKKAFLERISKIESMQVF